MDKTAVKTTIPIFFLIGAGLLSRKTGILKSGDERVLSAYVYYFAMSALSLLNLAETEERSMIFRKGEWCKIWDGLNWRFIYHYRDFLKKNPRMKVMINQIDRMGRE